MHLPPRRANLPALTSLRFFAAVIVVLAHLESGGVPLLAVNGGAAAGYHAVTFFFVLSGFILVYVYSGPREGEGLSVAPQVFLAARFARIGPAYYLGLALMLPLFLYRSFVLDLVPPESSVAALLLAPVLMQAWYPPAALAWNGPAWSLSVEVAFYLLFPFLLRQSNRITRYRFLALAIGAVVATGLARRLYSEEITYAHPLFHLAWFVFGMALGRVYLFGPALPRRAREMLSLVSGPLSARWLVLLGEASFSIYILHTGLIFWLHWILREAFGLVPAGNADFALTFGFVIGVSLLVYRFYEKPMRGLVLERALDGPAAGAGARVSSANG
jgi:peptidoglycan/LPS O-acetylase OafA/YrhL